MVSVTSMLASRATATSASKRSMASERAAARPPVAASRRRPASALAARGLEADLGGLALRFTAQLEELARREAERAGDQVRGKLRDARVQVAHHRVVVAARVLHRVLDLAEASSGAGRSSPRRAAAGRPRRARRPAAGPA